MIITAIFNLREKKQIEELTEGAFTARHLKYLIAENVDGFRDTCCIRTRGRWLIDLQLMKAWVEANNRAVAV